MSVEFVFRGVTFVLRRHWTGEPGFKRGTGKWMWQYRDKAHLGGPWSCAENAIANRSLALGFRRALENAIADAQAELDELGKVPPT